jgi:hypothetical protein
MNDNELVVPWWLKIAVGVGGMALMAKFFSMAELFNYFVMIVALPLAFLSFGYAAADGLYDAVAGAIPRALDDLRDRAKYYEGMKASAHAAAAAEARANAAAAAEAAARASS